MKVREKCYSGEWKESPLHILDITAPGVPDTKYSDHHYRAISKEKMANMVTMYDRFIPPSRHPDYLPSLETSATTPRSSSSTSSTTASDAGQSKRKLHLGVTDQVIEFRVDGLRDIKQEQDAHDGDLYLTYCTTHSLTLLLPCI